MSDTYDYIDIPGFGQKRVITLSEGITVSDFGNANDCYVTLAGGKRAVLVKMSEEVQMTQEGGLAVKMINKTGAPSIKGYLVKISPTVDNGAEYTIDDDLNWVGVVYEAGVIDGNEMWVVIEGKAEVYYGTAVNRGTFSRVPAAGEAIASGQALNEPFPAPPFVGVKHFQEVGHPLVSIVGPGLALTLLHKN